MTRFPFVIGTVAVFVLGVPPALSGQVVTGRVVDAANENGLRNAFVEIFDGADQRVGAALADGNGRFRVTLEVAGGPFRIEVNSLSHEGARVDSLHVAEDEVLVVPDFRLAAAPILLEGIVARGQQSRITLGREAIRGHQLLGRGTFLAGAVIGAQNPPSLTQHIAEASGLWISPRRDGAGPGTLRNLQSTTGYDCVVVMVNRWPLNRPSLDGGPPIGFRDLDDVPLDWIAGVEIFNDYNDVPDLYWTDAIVDPGFGAPPAYCGFVNIWLTNSWF